MRVVLCGLVAMLGCGDNAGGTVPEVEGGCREFPSTDLEAQFDRASELGPMVAYTLDDDFDPSGRWFFTDAFLGRSSTVIERDASGWRSSNLALSRSSSELFGTHLQHRVADIPLDPPVYEWRFSERFSNLREDGSMRYDYAYCDGETCRRCTARMIRAERHDPQPSDKLSLAGQLAPPKQWPGRTLDVDVLDLTAYVIGEPGLLAVDVTDPANPIERGRYPDPDRDSRANDVAVFEATNGRRYALIADSPVQIVDVTDPAALTPVAELGVEAHTLFLETRAGTTRAYFGSLDGTCPVFDITDPTHPVRLGAFDTSASYVHDLFVENGIGYLNAWEKGFFVVDFTDPAAPKALGRWRTPRVVSHASWVTTIAGRRVAVHGEETYGAHMTVLDVEPTSPQFMRPLSEYETRAYVSIHNFTGTGTKTYFTYYQDGVRVVDLADPTAPKLVGYFNTWDPDDPAAATDFFSGAIGLDLDVARKLVFVADIERGLLILRDET